MESYASVNNNGKFRFFPVVLEKDHGCKLGDLSGGLISFENKGVGKEFLQCVINININNFKDKFIIGVIKLKSVQLLGVVVVKNHHIEIENIRIFQIIYELPVINLQPDTKEKLLS